MSYLVQFFAWLMEWCHSWCPNYWADIVIFTFFTKILQFPVSLWCQVNSLKMVSLMPQTNRIKMNHYGDSDTIGEKTAELFKREHYHPLLSLVPLAIQIVILMAFVKVIYGIGGSVTPSTSSYTYTFDLHLKISDIPIRDGGISWLMPLFAGAAAWLLGYTQNIFNPLQHEQTRTQQLITNGISICISLFLGCFVAAGVGLYWATSNVFSILVQLGENLCIPPKKHVNYPELRRSQVELAKFEAALKKSEKTITKEDKRREKADYKRFFSIANKHLVFYAEGGGYYKYFQSVIEWLLANTKVTIHYVTNDPHDKIFDLVEGVVPRCRSTKEGSLHCTPTPSTYTSRIRPYYIGATRIIPLMMKMDADMVVMTTPDLNTYQIKRSYVKKDVEYVYLDHGPTSVHMCYRKGAFNHFDTIMCNGPFQVAEHRATEKLYGLKPKTLIESGYPLLDTLSVNATAVGRAVPRAPSAPRIMLANSHQPDNIFDSCLDDLIASIVHLHLESTPITIVIRPHPQYVRRFPARWAAIKEKLGLGVGRRCTKEGSDSTVHLHLPPTPVKIVFEDDFGKPSTMDQSDILITDWSGIAYEFAYKTRRPTLFVNTPMKVINPEWKKIDIVPTDISFRDEVGVSIDPSTLNSQPSTLNSILSSMLSNPSAYAQKIDNLFATQFFNPGHAGPAIGQYIISSLKSKQSKRR